MEKKDYIESPEEDHFEDANDKVIDDLMGSIKISGLEREASESSAANEQEKESFEECESLDLIDDESQQALEENQTEEERDAARLKAEELKKEGNELFKNGDYIKSADIYTSALRTCPVRCATERSILYGNRAAAKHKLDLKPAAIDDCSKAIEFNPNYVKVLLR